MEEQIIKWFGSFEHKKAYRNELRKCRNIDEVYRNSLFHTLNNIVNPSGKGDVSERVAVAAAVIGHVKEHSSGCYFAKQLKTHNVNIRKLNVTIGRQIDTRTIHSIRRLLPRINRRIDVIEFVKDIAYWNNKTVRKWYSHYYFNE